jgi:hypothetical protein
LSRGRLELDSVNITNIQARFGFVGKHRLY